MEQEAFAANYKGIIKLVEGIYGVPLERESFLLPSLADGMIHNTDMVLINKVAGTDVPLFTTIDLLCVNPKVCFEGPRSSLYSQMVKKEHAFMREDPSVILKRLEHQAYSERVLYDANPERYPDGEGNAEALDCLKHPLAESLAQRAHVVMLDPFCDRAHRALIAEHLTEKFKEECDAESLVMKILGAERVLEGTSLGVLHNSMVEGHDGLCTPLD